MPTSQRGLSRQPAACLLKPTGWRRQPGPARAPTLQARTSPRRRRRDGSPAHCRARYPMSRCRFEAGVCDGGSAVGCKEAAQLRQPWGGAGRGRGPQALSAKPSAQISTRARRRRRTRRRKSIGDDCAAHVNLRGSAAPPPRRPAAPKCTKTRPAATARAAAGAFQPPSHPASHTSTVGPVRSRPCYQAMVRPVRHFAHSAAVAGSVRSSNIACIRSLRRAAPGCGNGSKPSRHGAVTPPRSPSLPAQAQGKAVPVDWQ